MEKEDKERIEKNAEKYLIETYGDISILYSGDVDKMTEAYISGATAENKLLREEIKQLKEALNGNKQKKKCPECHGSDVIMFTPDLDICQCCGHTFI